jgi:TRAP-type C4-dicarboxylate transport system substrate-binding protein
MIRMRFAVVIATPLLALAAAGCGSTSNDKAGGARGKPVVLTLASHEMGADVQEWIDAVARLSGGSLRIEVKRGWRGHEVDYEKHTLADVRSGKVDLASIPAQAYDTFGVRSFQALLAPFLIDSYALERSVLASDLPGQLLPGIKPLGVVGISLLPGELQKVLSVDTPMLGPSDYRGAQIGIRPSELAARSFRALGATSKDLAPGGDFDGFEQGVFQIVANGYEDATPDETLPINVNFWPRVTSVVVNEKKYDALAPEQREILRDAGRDALGPAMKRLAHEQDEALDVICNLPERDFLFLKATPSDLAALRRAVRPVYRRLDRDPATRRAVKSITAMKKNVTAEPIPSCPGALPRRVSAHAAAVAVNVDLNKTGPTTWQGTVTSKQLGRGRFALQGHVYFSKLIPRHYLEFKARFPKGQLRGCVISGPGVIAGASRALRRYVGLSLRFRGFTKKGDQSHMHGGFKSDAPTGLLCH